MARLQGFSGDDQDKVMKGASDRMVKNLSGNAFSTTVLGSYKHPNQRTDRFACNRCTLAQVISLFWHGLQGRARKTKPTRAHRRSQNKTYESMHFRSAWQVCLGGCLGCVFGDRGDARKLGPQGLSGAANNS
jgi:hypothetical protein